MHPKRCHIGPTLTLTLRRHADALLRNMWRWLCSPGAAMACAPLQRHVAGLMRKLLAQLVGDLRRLGAQARLT